jgi:hypothetical protein
MGGTGGIRFLAAGVASVVALLYLLIGFDVITVVEDQATAGAAPVFIAGLVFAALAVLLVTASRPVLVGGAVLQVVVLVMYVVVSSERIPAFEAWGLGLKALQVVLLVALTSMLVRQSHRVRSGAGTPA